MTLRTITTYVCDPCLDAGRETAATATRRIAIDAYEATVDLCPDHDAAMMGALRALLSRRGGRGVICEHCGHVAKSPTGLAAHARRADHHRRLRAV